jgi:SagB-type dehydrogenase family enzyme
MLTGVFERTILKYGERGYRFVLLEVGHIAQNLCLLAEEMGLGAVCLGGFYDREVETVLGIDGTDESILYLVAVGHKAVTEDGNE